MVLDRSKCFRTEPKLFVTWVKKQNCSKMSLFHPSTIGPKLFWTRSNIFEFHQNFLIQVQKVFVQTIAFSLQIQNNFNYHKFFLTWSKLKPILDLSKTYWTCPKSFWSYTYIYVRFISYSKCSNWRWISKLS